MSDDSFDHKKVMYELDESQTYKNINLKNETSMCFEDDVVANKSMNLNNFVKCLPTSPQQNQLLIKTDIIQDTYEVRLNVQEDSTFKKSEAQNSAKGRSDKNNRRTIDFTFQNVFKKQSIGNTPDNNSLSQTQIKKLDQNTKLIRQTTERYYISIQLQNRRRSKALNKLIETQEKNSGLSLFMLTRVKPKIMNYINLFTSFGRKKQLTKHISSLIKDPIDYEFGQQYTFIKNRIFSFLLIDQIVKIFKLFEEVFFNVLSYLPLLNPENKLRILINVIIACYSSFYLFITSLTIFFEAHFGVYDYIFHQIATVAWISEMLLSMNTFCYHHGQFITDRKQIMKIYLQEYFFFEVLPLIFEGRKSSNIYYNVLLHLPLLLKLKGIQIIMTKIEFFILQHIRYPYTISFMKLIIEILLLTHLMACSYHAFGQFEKNILNDNNSWVSNNEFSSGKDQWWQLYFEAQHWAFLTMSSSYSQSVHTQFEHAFTSFWMLISCILYAFLINMIGDILRDINSQSESYKKDLNILNRFMKRKKIDIEIQRAMNVHLKKNYDHFNRKNLEEEKETLNQLGSEMKEKLIIESNKKVLSQFPFFSSKLSQQSLSLLYSKFEEETYMKGEYINLRDQINYDPYIFLITKGEVTLMYDQQDNKQENEEDENNNNSLYSAQQEKIKIQKTTPKPLVMANKQKKQPIIKKIGVGKCIGEIEFFSNIKQNIIAQCSKKSILVKIQRSNLLSILSQNGQDYEIFKQCQDLFTFNREYNLIKGLSCYICGSEKHMHENCHLAHFSKQNPFIIPRSNKSINQQRFEQYQRKGKRKQWIIKHIEPTSAVEQTDNNISTLKFIPETNQEIKNHNDVDQFQIHQEKQLQQQTQQDQTIYSKEKTANQNKNSEVSNPIYEDLWQNELQIQNPSSFMFSTQLRSKQLISPYSKDDQITESYYQQTHNNNNNNEFIDKNISNIICSIFPEEQFKKDQEEHSKKNRQTRFRTNSILVDINDIQVSSQANIKDKKRNSITKQIPYQYQQVSSLEFLSNQVGGGVGGQKLDQSFLAPSKLNEKLIFANFNWNESIAYWLFDYLKSYEFYFPKYNYKEVIKKVMVYKRNALQKKKKTIVQKSKISQYTSNSILQ